MILKDQKEEKVYSDGETVENEMLRIAEEYPEDLSQDYIADDSRYTINNTFSAVRRNILNWYPFKENCSILEVGAGMGALTGLLCDKAANVTAIEMSEARAAVIRARYSERKNLDIVSADINNWQDKRKFDYVVVIGVLEYAAIFSEAKNPYVEFITSLGEHLKDDGKVLLAIENRFGLKYFSGASEDHLQRPFVGLEGYENNGPRTFSKKELESLFETAGMKHHRTYMVFPDYKFPELICTEERLPDYKTLKKLSFTHGNNSAVMYDEKKLYKHIIANGVLSFFANSFLVEASKEELENKHVTYISARSETKKEYRIDTVIYNDNTIVKIPAHDSATKHLNDVINNTEWLNNRGVLVSKVKNINGLLECEYSTGEDSQNYFEQCLENNDIEQLYSLIDELKRNVSMSSEESFEEVDAILKDISKEKLGRILKNGFIDMSFYNSTLKNGTMEFYDQEWNFENIPEKFIIYYAVKSSYKRSDANTSISFDDLLTYIGVDEQMAAVFDKYETEIWSKVILRGGDKYGGDGYCNLYCGDAEAYVEVRNRIKEGNIKEVVKECGSSQLLAELKLELEETNNKLREVNKKLAAIENSLGWRIVSCPGKMYVVLRKKIENVLKTSIKYISAIKISNFKYIIKVFKTGGFRQVKRELRAFLFRQNGQVEQFHKPKLYEEINEENYDDLKILEFKESESPLVSIVIPVYNQFGYTYNCLKSILNNSNGIDYEIIIANDCSTDFTAHIEDKVKGIKIINNVENLRFLRNCNNAALSARGKYILFLNNDTQVLEGWLDSLIDLIESNDSIGMVGSKLIYPDGSLQEAGGILWKNGLAWNFGNGDHPDRPEYNYVKECDYISGASIMIKTSLWDEIGGFDERFVPAYCEDSDLAFEVRRHGYKVMYQPKSVVVHFEGKSNGTDVNKGQKHYQIENQEKFYEKWKAELKENNYCSGTNIFKACDRSKGKKTILVVDHYVPEYDKDAGSKTTWQYLKMFVEKGFKVVFWGDNLQKSEPYTSILQNMGIEVIYGAWYANKFEQWLEDNERYIDIAYLNRPHITVNYIDIIRKYKHIKIIYYGHDLHFLRLQREYELNSIEEKKEESEEWKATEFEIMKKADISYYPSKVEVDAIHQINGEILVKDMTAYVYSDFRNDINFDFESRKDIIFVGGFGHPPNLDAVMWFAKEIWPVIHTELNVNFHIVGAKVTSEIESLSGKNGIIVDGFVSEDRLKELYDNCRLVIVPLRYGAGVKGKVIEALYNGLPIVTTSVGAEGIEKKDNILEIVDDAVLFAKKCIDMYNDTEKLSQISKASQEYIKNYFSVDAVWDKISEDFT